VPYWERARWFQKISHLIARTNDESAVFSLIFEVLGKGTDSSKLKDRVLYAKGGIAFDDHVGLNFRPLTDLNLGTDDRVGSHLDIGIQLCMRINNRCRMNFAHTYLQQNWSHSWETSMADSSP